MGALVLVAVVASIFLVVSVTLEAYLLARTLRALELGGAKATFRRAVVVCACMLPFGFAFGLVAHYVAEASGLGSGAELALSFALGIPLHLAAFRKGFDLAAVDAVVLVVVFYLAALALGMLLWLGVAFTLHNPFGAIALGAIFAVGGWIGRARRAALVKRLNAVS